MSHPGQTYRADPTNPRVQQALAYNHLSQVPNDWVMDGSGQLHQGGDATGPLVSVGPPIQESFLNELLHASPYIGLATVGLGGLSNAIGGVAAGTQGVPSLVGAGAKVAKPLASLAMDGSSGGSSGGPSLGNSMASSSDGTGGGGGGNGAAKLASLAAFAPLLYLMLNKHQNPGQLIASIPGGQELLNQSITQSRQQAPVRTAAMQQALNTLPNTAFGSGGRPDLSAIPQANYGPAAGNDSSGALAQTLKLLGAGAGGFLLGNNTGGILDVLKKLFGGGGGNNRNVPQFGASNNSYNLPNVGGSTGFSGLDFINTPGDVVSGMPNALPGALDNVPGLDDMLGGF